MSTDKYSPTLKEFAVFKKGSQIIKSELNSLLQLGVERLHFGMNQWNNYDNKSSFIITEPPYPYNEKNLYVNASNNLWYETIWSFPSLDEIYYQTLLNEIKNHQVTENFNFNKGIVYANLGVAQSAQMKLDEGFANILKALIEDSGYSKYDLFKRDLFTQFENRYVKVKLNEMISQLQLEITSPSEQFIENFLNFLNDDQRVFFDYTFSRIIQNVKIWKEKNNKFTANRLLAYTQDLCLFTEDFLKSKISNSILSHRRYWDLKNLITQEFSRVDLRNCSANTMSDFDRILTSNMSSQNQPEKCLRILLSIRNYASHNVGVGTNTNYFYANYDNILLELIRAMCFVILLN
ncbi:MAG: hypothetical protein NWE89_14265 [Candidatus Bathyarchaeota archaeon]|nr:hypothetical protein [Candidatus Bathyarchaeota archaeon]